MCILCMPSTIAGSCVFHHGFCWWFQGNSWKLQVSQDLRLCSTGRVSGSSRRTHLDWELSSKDPMKKKHQRRYHLFSSIELIRTVKIRFIRVQSYVIYVFNRLPSMAFLCPCRIGSSSKFWPERWDFWGTGWWQVAPAPRHPCTWAHEKLVIQKVGLLVPICGKIMKNHSGSIMFFFTLFRQAIETDTVWNTIHWAA